MEVVATETSLSFFDHKEIEKTGVRVWRDKDEWGAYVTIVIFVPGYPLVSEHVSTGTI